MKQMFKLILIVMLLGLFANAWSLVSEYSFSQSTTTYTEITGGTVLGTTSSDDQRFVDPAVPAGGTTNTGVGLPIGFNFTFDGTVYDRIGINYNAWISFGRSALGATAVNMSTTSAYTPLSSTTAITPTDLRNRVAVFAKDLQGQTGSELMILTTGTAPNRVCVIQWKGVKIYSTGGTGTILNYQIRLEETTNKVIITYGANTGNTTANYAQVGLGGSAATDYNARQTANDWNATTAGASNAANCLFQNTIVPASGLTFTYTPPVAGTAPNPANIVSPANAATLVAPASTLNWSSGGGMPSGYRLYFGTNTPPTNLVNGTDLGNVTTYDPNPDLTLNTVYYWQVVPYNANGNAAGCPIWSFTSHTGQAPLLTPANAATDINITNVSFSWTAVPTATSYTLRVGTTPGGSQIVNGTTVTSPYVLVGPLTYSTTYYWAITSNFATGSPVASAEFSFTTSADPSITTFPTAYGFEPATYPPTGWTHTLVSGTSGIQRASSMSYPTLTAGHTGAYFGYYNSYSISSGGNAWLATPPITCGGGTGWMYTASFWMYRDNGYNTAGYAAEGYNVYVNNSASLTGATLLGYVPRAITFAPVVATEGWYQYTFNIGDGTVGTKYVILQAWSVYGNNMAIDDIVIDRASLTNPPNPAVLVSPANGATGLWAPTVTLNWAQGGNFPSSYDVYFGTTLPGTPNANVTTTTWTPPTLAWNTTYSWMIVPKNANGDATGCPTWTFTTGPDPTITSTPYTQNFDGVTAPALPWGWTKYLYSTTTYAVVQTSTTNHSAPNGLYMYNSSDGSTTVMIAISPRMGVPINGNVVQFWANGSGSIQVGTITTPTDGATFTAFQTIPITATWTQYTVNFSGYAGADQYIAFKHANLATYQSQYIDDISIIPATFNDYAPTAFSSSPLYKFVNAEATLTATIRNNGFVQAGTNVSFYDGATLLGTVATGTILTNATANVSLPYTFTTSGDHVISVSVPSDDVTANDTYAAGTLSIYADSQLAEGFEGVTFPPSRWQTPDTPAWVRTTTAGEFYNGVAASKVTLAIGQNSNLVTPKLSFTPARSFFQFWAKASVAGLQIQVQHASDVAGPWTADGSVIALTTTWTQYTAAVSALDGNYFVGFKAMDNGLAGSVYVDHVVGPVIYNPPEPPGPVVMVSPINGDTDIDPMTFALDWDVPLLGGLPSNYGVFVAEAPDDIYGTYTAYQDVTPPTTVWTPYPGTLLDYNKWYYWTVYPTNIDGMGPDPAECPIWSFRTTEQMHIASTTLDLGTRYPGSTATGTIAVQNVGPTDLTFNAVGAGFTFGSRFIVSAGTTYNMPYSYLVPEVLGVTSGTITLTETSPGNSSATIDFTVNVEASIVIGNGTSDGQLPVYPYYTYTYSQTIYNQSEIGVSGKRINTISYYYNGNQTWDDQLKIYMGHTNKTEFTSTSDWVPLSSLQLVYNGAYSLPATAGWYTFTLDTPFTYNNTDNLIVAVNEDFGPASTYTSSSAYFYSTATSTNRSIMTRNDTAPYVPESNSYSGTLKMFIPNTKFTLEDVPDMPIFSVNPDVKDFGQVTVNTSHIQTFTVANMGGGNINVSDIQLSGDPCFVLANVPSMPFDLGIAGSRTFDVEFTPSAAGAYTGTITITDGRAITTIDLSGSCIDPTITEFPYVESFDTWPPAYWDLTGGTYSFTQYTGPDTRNWAKANYWSQTSGNTDIMTMPPVIMGTPGGVRFMWSHLYSASYPNDALTVRISTDMTTWTDIWSLAGADFNSGDGAGNTSAGTGVWATAAIPAQFCGTGTPFFVQFYGYSGYGPDLYIDQVELQIVDLSPPTIVHYPLINTPRNDMDFEIQATIADDTAWNNGISSATLYYEVNAGGVVSVPMTVATGDVYTAIIPAQAYGSTIVYHIEAVDNSAQLNATVGASHTFMVDSPVWLQYDIAANNAYGLNDVYGVGTVFANPFGANPLQINSIATGLYNAGTGTIHIYDLNLVDLIDPIAYTFAGTALLSEVIPINATISVPAFMVAVLDIATGNWVPLDETVTDFAGTSYFESAGSWNGIENYGITGAWTIRANVEQGTASLEAPVVTITWDTDNNCPFLAWPAVAGAASYSVWSDVSASGTFATLVGTTVDAFYTVLGEVAPNMCYRVIASSAAPVLAHRGNSIVRPTLHHTNNARNSRVHMVACPKLMPKK